MLFLQVCRRCKAFFIPQVHQIYFATAHNIAHSKINGEILKKMGYKKGDFKRVLPKKRTIRELNLEKVVNKLHELGFTHEDIRKQPKIMWLHPFLIDHRYNILEESGMTKKLITLEKIRKFPRLNSTSVQTLKQSCLISQETDIAHNILGFSDLPRELYPPKTNDRELFGYVQTKALQIYLSWKLGLSVEEVKNKYVSHENMYQKSIRLVMRSYDTLIHCFKLPVHKVRQNIFVLACHPENFLEIQKCLPKLGDASIESIACTNPKILMRPVKKMMKIVKIMRNYNVPDQGFIYYSNILTLSPDTVQERAAALYADPVINPFFCSPRIAFLIARYHISMSRYQLLTSMKWRCLSLSLLTNVEDQFQKRINLGQDDSSKGSDMLYYLKMHLGYEIKEIKNQIMLHPFFFLLPLTLIADTLQYLLANGGVSKADIFKALPIVLYPKEKVARWLKQVHSQPEVEHLRDEEGKVPSSVVLQLVLYYMERPHHFSGHGVWSEQDFGNVPSVQ
ncbi:transcription termination factor 5, mitochondrial [Macrosteles quadrilineatus]|uniref:transcription termination factor 5, mitochondrial n=1 Tax=Macrosteles quadrilineatus TaxID=74068 RepID=UPI0023E17CD4|nr:transcription termination factor 5, mitochondrial [Macrosteles quadrilineatus]XP_054282713.1 transcription termination factor 5, mitochondrial [Macrosteles quadrilineatus]